MKPNYSWKGNEKNKGGEATFILGDYKFTLPMNSFAECISLHSFLMKAYLHGERDAIAHIEEGMRVLLTETKSH